MPTEPQIVHLSYKRRQRLFFVLFTVFIIALPAMIFYTTGYRLSFENQETSIVTTGGMYITTDNLEVDVYLDQEQVERPRLFRSAYYIQNIESGVHRIVVQRSGLQTWVKELPVDSHIVVEASAFNMPVIPQLRPITKYSLNGVSVYQGVASTTNIFLDATTTVATYATTSMATTTLVKNEEYDFVVSLFSTTSTSSQSVFDLIMSEVERFRFSTTSQAESGTSTIIEESTERGNMRLIERKNEIFAVWLGDVRNIPYYFCVVDKPLDETAIRYGQHVADAIKVFKVSTTTPMFVDGQRICRPEIKLNRLRKDVYFYDFFPGTSDMILLQLEDGLYVTEVDDRAWQNTQLLYPGSDFRVVVENDLIYISDKDYYFEVMTEIESI